MPSFTRALGGALVLCTLQGSARAEPPRVFDRVVAVVDHDVILASEVARRVRPLLSGVKTHSEAEAAAQWSQATRQMLERVIDDRLVVKEAARTSVVVTPEEMERALAQVMKQNGLDRATLFREIEAHGYTESDYLEELKMQILRAKLLAPVAPQQGIRPTDAEIDATLVELRKVAPAATREQAVDAVMTMKLGRLEKEWLSKLRSGVYIEVRL